MATEPVLAGATFYDRYILIATRPVDQNVAITELAAVSEGDPVVDPSLFVVLEGSTPVPVIEVFVNKGAILTLSRPLNPRAKVTVTYNAPPSPQMTGVLQDEEGEDAASATLQATFTTGFETRLLDGAELGASYGISDDEWFYGSGPGAYVSNEEGAGGQPDTPITVVSTTQSTFTVRLQPTRLYDNPSYSETAAVGSFASFRYSNELSSIEFLKQGRDISVGDSFSLLELVDPDRNEKFVSGKLSVMVNNQEGEAVPEKVFDIMSYKAKATSEVFWLFLNSFLYESQGADFNQTVLGSTFEDEIVTLGGNDSISSGGGDDTIISGSGNDSVAAAAGNDVIVGGEGAGNDSYDGGVGIDSIVYTSALEGITVNLARGTATSSAGNDTAGIGTDRLKSIESITAGNFNDALAGSKDANSISGQAGNDTIDGGLGLDTLTGGSGADTFAFSTKASGANIDTISDFEIDIDRVQLSRKVFSKLSVGVLDPASFVAGTSAAKALDANDYLIFNGTQLLYDADGSGKGAAVVIANVVGVQASNIFTVA